MKEKIDVFEKAPEILRNLQKGILLTTKAGDQVNTMTIGWGTLGIEWLNRSLRSTSARTASLTNS